jgi:ABC-type transport system involved in cytochrome c biogenesis permease subunit
MLALLASDSRFERLLSSLDPTRLGLFDSGIWLRITNLLCLAGILLAVAAAWSYGRRARAKDATGAGAPFRGPLASRINVGVLTAACVTIVVSICYRWVEVNHFPSQTMGEVLVMFSAMLLISMLVLYFALGMRRIGPGWGIVEEGLMLSVFAGTWAVNHYTTTLSTAQRDLPPALQSYWFAPHVAALVFSYATLGIAALLCVSYFAIRLWSQLLWRPEGGAKRSQTWQVLALLALLAVPFLPLGLARMAGGEGPAGIFTGAWISLLVLGGVAATVLRFMGAGHARTASLVLIYLGLAIVPFAQFVTVPVLALSGVVFLILHRTGWSPPSGWLPGLEKTLDDVSFRAFAVGFPFLTAGLYMGAFWAQDAWANYWGWDSKENTALISWLIYVVYVHLRLLGGYRGEKAMAALVAGAFSIFITFQIFGYLPDSQKSLHRYTDDGVVPQEGMIGPAPEQQAALEAERRDGADGSR